MTRIIEFSETLAALLAGQKTCTRREWKPQYAARWKAGDEAIAYSKSPRKGGKPVARIRLTEAPYLESSERIPFDDFVHEGFAYMRDHGLTLFGGASPGEVWADWHRNRRDLWVVRFSLVSVIK